MTGINYFYSFKKELCMSKQNKNSETIVLTDDSDITIEYGPRMNE